MNEPQVWTLVGALAAGQVMLIMLVLRVVSAEISGLRHEMVARFEHLDHDVQAIAAKVFPRD